MRGLETVLTNLLPSIQIKQIEAIKNYIDPKKSGSVTKEGFTKAIEKSKVEMRNEIC